MGSTSTRGATRRGSIVCAMTAMALVPGPLTLGAPRPVHAQATGLPTMEDLPPGWSTISPGGDTGCAYGEPYEFYVRPGDPTRVFVFLEGGGACWDGDTCDPEREDPVYSSSLDDTIHPRRLSGLFDRDHPDNPVADYTMVFGPYCTGDVHLGDRVATYERAGGAVTIHHTGFVNATALLDWVTQNVPAPETIVVAGSSAGAVGAPVHASRFAARYPDARVVGLGDGAGSYRNGALPDVDPVQWGLPGVLQRTARWQDFPYDEFGTETLFRHAAATAGNLTLAQFDQARDATQRFYLDLAGSPDPDVEGLLATNRAELEREIPGFTGFTVGGVEHTVLGLPQLYFYTAGDRRLVDWLGDVVRGDDPAASACDPCDRPTLAFSAADLDLLDGALAELADSASWDPAQPESATCGRSADRRSLWCAIAAAAERLRGPSPFEYAATWEAAYEAMARLGDDVFDRPLTRYNNDPSTGHDEILDLLRTVRQTVAAQLSP